MSRLPRGGAGSGPGRRRGGRTWAPDSGRPDRTAGPARGGECPGCRTAASSTSATTAVDAPSSAAAPAACSSPGAPRGAVSQPARRKSPPRWEGGGGPQMQRWPWRRSDAGRVGGGPEEAAPGAAEAEDAAEGGQSGGRGAVGQNSLRYADRSYVNVVLPPRSLFPSSPPLAPSANQERLSRVSRSNVQEFANRISISLLKAENGKEGGETSSRPGNESRAD